MMTSGTTICVRRAMCGACGARWVREVRVMGRSDVATEGGIGLRRPGGRRALLAPAHNNGARLKEAQKLPRGELKLC
jgi:hypothetical protein